MRKVHGIDLGTRSLHVYTQGIGPQTIEVPKSDRYTEIHGLSLKMRTLFDPDDYVFYEEAVLAGPRNIRTLIALAQSSAAILSASRARCYEVPVTTWKKEVIGIGNAKKEDIAAWLKATHPEMYSQCVNQNHIDAACIHLYGKLVVDRLTSVA